VIRVEELGGAEKPNKEARRKVEMLFQIGFIFGRKQRQNNMQHELVQLFHVTALG
jgi:hypothetical protein